MLLHFHLPTLVICYKLNSWRTMSDQGHTELPQRAVWTKPQWEEANETGQMWRLHHEGTRCTNDILLFSDHLSVTLPSVEPESSITTLTGIIGVSLGFGEAHVHPLGRDKCSHTWCQTPQSPEQHTLPSAGLDGHKGTDVEIGSGATGVSCFGCFVQRVTSRCGLKAERISHLGFTMWLMLLCWTEGI